MVGVRESSATVGDYLSNETRHFAFLDKCLDNAESYGWFMTNRKNDDFVYIGDDLTENIFVEFLLRGSKYSTYVNLKVLLESFKNAHSLSDLMQHISKPDVSNVLAMSMGKSPTLRILGFDIGSLGGDISVTSVINVI